MPDADDRSSRFTGVIAWIVVALGLAIAVGTALLYVHWRETERKRLLGERIAELQQQLQEAQLEYDREKAERDRANGHRAEADRPPNAPAPAIAVPAEAEPSR